MRVITASEYRGPEVLRVDERPAPQLKPDEALVEVKVAGINLMDTYARRGMNNEMFPLPLSLGVDGAGVVTAVGDRSTARVGDRVAWERVPGSSSSVPTESMDQRRQRASQVMQWIEYGTLDVLVDRTYSLNAHRDLESQETVGKLLLIP